MAYSNEITCNYKIYESGVFNLSQVTTNTSKPNHLASPDVIVDNKNQQIIMYFHCPYNNKCTNQSTFYAISTDGINFVMQNENIIYPYFRYFCHDENEYGIAMNRTQNSSYTSLMKRNKLNKNFEEICRILPNSRHACIFKIYDKLFVLYSIVGDCPEHIYICELVIDKTIETKNETSLIMPKLDYEHFNNVPKKSTYGMSHNAMCQLQDPYVYIENNIIYVLYVVAGEKGIAISILHGII
jgi:hypothetical protein